MTNQVDPKTTEGIARAQAERWRNNPYYDDAESKMERHWNEIVFPIIRDADFSSVLELACGHGRNSERILKHAGRLTLVDVNQENVDFCRKRFSGRDADIEYVVNNGALLTQIPSQWISLVYCYDSMVHFHSDVVRSYLREFRRILRPGGRAFLHHSNSTSSPGELDIKKHRAGRNFMSQSMFLHYAITEGLSVISSKIIDWGGEKNLDCLTYLESR